MRTQCVCRSGANPRERSGVNCYFAPAPESEPSEIAEASDTPSAPSYLSEHPVAVAILLVAMIAGAGISFTYLSETLSPVRSVLGGAVADFGCWLLVMVGRVIGD